MSSIVLSGTGKWFNNLFTPDGKFGDPFYSIVLYPDEASMAIYRDQKLRLRTKDDEEGTYLRLRKNHAAVKFDGVEFAPEGPPPVVDKDGNPWNPEVIIGNGSKCSCIVEVYKSKFGNAHRLVKVRVDELVEYKVETKEKMPF